MPKNDKKEKKKPKGMSSKNLKEHRSFYKWIKDYGAALRNFHDVLDEIIARVEAIEKKLGINENGGVNESPNRV